MISKPNDISIDYFSMASKVIGKCEKNFIIRCLRERQVT